MDRLFQLVSGRASKGTELLASVTRFLPFMWPAPPAEGRGRADIGSTHREAVWCPDDMARDFLK